jgi:hypothetical protein
MTRALLVSLLLLPALAACRPAAAPVVTPVPGHGAISIEVVPNPIVVKKVTGSTYEFPFEVVVNETGGRRVRITEVSITVFLASGFLVGSEEWSATEIAAMGASPDIPASTTVHYRFSPRRQVPDERYFKGITAELKVEAVDDAGTKINARTSVTAGM